MYQQRSVGLIKFLYFMLYAAAAAWMTYFYVYLEDVRKLSGIEIGAIAAVQQLNNIVFLPLWGMVSDRYGRRKIFITLLAVSLSLLCLFLVKGGFWYYLFFMVVFSAFNNPIGALIDSFAIEKSKQAIINSSYGEMRLWASLGWSMSAFATGFFIQYTSIKMVFPLASFILFVTWIVSFKYLSKKREITSNVTPSIRSFIDFLNQNKQLMFFFAFLMVYYILNAPTMMFINLYYTEMGASNLQIGTAFAVQSLFEIPFMFFGAKLIERYGVKKIIFFALTIAVIRMFLYGITSNPWIAIAVGSLHGITLGLFLVAAIDYTHNLVSPMQNSTAQTLLYTFLGLGNSIGNFLNGIMKDTLSLKTAMKVDSGLLLLVIVVAFFVLKRGDKGSSI